MSLTRRRVAVMGVTGSIGRQTLDVLRTATHEFELVAVAGGARLSEIADICREFSLSNVGVRSDEDAVELRSMLGPRCNVVVGAEGLADLSRDADIVVNAVVGFAGLPVTLATLEAGARLALANKESLIAAAPLVEKVRRTPGAEIWPVDSEHCAIHQCLAGASQLPGRPDVEKLWLTASGGPFRGFSADQLDHITIEDALAHPTWQMGPKITVDSSTLMNKGLEVLEAAALFEVSVDRIDVVVHPQSIVHSLVEFVDGSVLAQLAQPDMRLPISYCLGGAERLGQPWGRMDFRQSWNLEFAPPDRRLFPALDVAYAAAHRGGAAPAWLSAANEVAVAAFLSGLITWRQIVEVTQRTMDQYEDVVVSGLNELISQDVEARRVATANLPRA